VEVEGEPVPLGDGRELWAQMQDERRAILTGNIGDFTPLATATAIRGGIAFVCTPRGSTTVPGFVRAEEARPEEST
jgi:hypothetical protein